MQLYYAGASRYIGLFGSREEACTAYKVARECMHSFSCLDPSPEQIVRNLDILRKAAISKAEIGVDHVGRSDQCAELQKRDVKPNGEITKLKSKGESCSLDRRLQVVATSASGRTNSGRTAALHVESRNRPEFVSSKTAGRSKYEAGSVEESSSTKNGARSPSRPKTLFTKEGPMEVDAASRSPIRSRPLLIMQPKEKTVEDGISLGDEVQNESTENGQTRTSMSIIYQKAMSMELPRGITVRPSGKWVSIASNFLAVVFNTGIVVSLRLISLAFTASPIILWRKESLLRCLQIQARCCCGVRVGKRTLQFLPERSFPRASGEKRQFD